MKQKRHWNSFTTSFLLTPKDIERRLEKQECISIDRRVQESLLKASLRCYRCGAALANMPKLKSHILSCKGGGQLLSTVEGMWNERSCVAPKRSRLNVPCVLKNSMNLASQ